MFAIAHSNIIWITISLWRSVSEKIVNGTHMLVKIFQLTGLNGLIKAEADLGYV